MQPSYSDIQLTNMTTQNSAYQHDHIPTITCQYETQQIPTVVPTVVPTSITPEIRIEPFDYERRKRFNWCIEVICFVGIYVILECIFTLYMDTAKIYLYVCLIITISGNVGVVTFALFNTFLDLFPNIRKIFIGTLSLINAINFPLAIEFWASEIQTSTNLEWLSWIWSFTAAVIMLCSITAAIAITLFAAVESQKCISESSLPSCRCCKHSSHIHLED